MKELKPRKRPRQSRSVELVDAILQAAARIFDDEGLEATTNRIAIAAGVSMGSLYQYFPNKQALLYALAEENSIAHELAGQLQRLNPDKAGSAKKSQLVAMTILDAIHTCVVGEEADVSFADELVDMYTAYLH